jgi:NAD(P)-dependent dehydrogenase (short-subunit alcohol dehydrogenase family)
MTHFAGKVVVVTGGGSGLGAAFSRALAADGASVVVADVRGDLAAQVAGQIGAEAAEVDVSDSKQIENLLQATKSKYGALNLVVNNAGILVGGESLEIEVKDWERVLQVNLMGVIAGSLAAYKIMAEQGSGQILNIGSISGLALVPMQGPYSPSKAGVVFFSRELAEEAKMWGVQVAVACPGNIQTSLLPAHTSWLTPAVGPDYAARRILDALGKRKLIIVFPMYAKLLWWLDRLSPALLSPLRKMIIERVRARAAKGLRSE